MFFSQYTGVYCTVVAFSADLNWTLLANRHWKNGVYSNAKCVPVNIQCKIDNYFYTKNNKEDLSKDFGDISTIDAYSI